MIQTCTHTWSSSERRNNPAIRPDPRLWNTDDVRERVESRKKWKKKETQITLFRVLFHQRYTFTVLCAHSGRSVDMAVGLCFLTLTTGNNFIKTETCVCECFRCEEQREKPCALMVSEKAANTVCADPNCRILRVACVRQCGVVWFTHKSLVCWTTVVWFRCARVSRVELARAITFHYLLCSAASWFSPVSSSSTPRCMSMIKLFFFLLLLSVLVPCLFTNPFWAVGKLARTNERMNPSNWFGGQHPTQNTPRARTALTTTMAAAN